MRIKKGAKILTQIKNDWLLYILLLPVLLWYLVFCYVPMAGVILAFKDYSFRGGLWGSPWLGLGNFIQMFQDPLFSGPSKYRHLQRGAHRFPDALRHPVGSGSQ